MEGTLWYIEDDEDMAVLVSAALEEAGLRVLTLPDGLSARNALAKRLPDALVIDWSLPDDDGASICRWARRRSAQLPIVMLTVRDDPADIVAGLEAGADDYVTKPFDMNVLESRIRALLRRANPAQRLECGPFLLDAASGSAFIGDSPINLTSLEFRLMTLLMRKKGSIVTREHLKCALWGADGAHLSDNALTALVKRLRAKLGDEHGIKTVRSFGYRMEEPR
ncbi:response regulator transcription factor [Adlercreutzia sp. ZJ473]|uniref:response regulator transcription factor n=1 Tax=Adlercreutzia sp. ZJ473 TaxID=2722822 RepID=UPI00155472EB|nr:response regulator transcription factor [Adlercreutzia sp. ZJ473]